MPLSAGTRLGPYEILAPIGKGGMGEVYRARDTKLDRDVAIKVLPDELAADEERIARFEREAKLLASLNHPNIASIYGFEENALVLELVEGPTLAERIAEGPIPGDETIAIAKQIAEALEAGHEAGVIHRDLKPANIKLKEDGTVKVLDYGLAKALEGDAPADTDSELSQSPTLTRQGTQVGVILGTAAYMSPEQAKGKRVDKRADIWAFGAVVCEMLTGRKLFQGEGVAETLASVIKSEPDWSSLPGDASPRLRELLRRCSAKDPAQRLRDIGDARLELEHILRHPDPDAPRLERKKGVPPYFAALASALLAGVLAWSLKPTAAGDAVTRLSINLPSEHELYYGVDREAPPFAISPDGRTIAYVGVESGVRRLFVRTLEATGSQSIDETDGAIGPFFSPDGGTVGFFAGGALRKVSLSNRVPVIVCQAPGQPGGASWSDDNTIVFTSGEQSSLMQVSADGGEPRPITTVNTSARELRHLWPDVMGNSVLYTIRRDINFAIGAIDLDTGASTIVIEGVRHARATKNGHLLYAPPAASAQQRMLYAAPYDARDRTLTGPGLPVSGGLHRSPGGGSTFFAVSESGTLIYAATPIGDLVSVDKRGVVEPLGIEPRVFSHMRLSVDGSKLAYGGGGTWVLDLERGTMQRFHDSGTWPVWRPGRNELTVFDVQDGLEQLFSVSLDRGEDARPLFESTVPQMPRSWSSDGSTLLFTQIHPETQRDIWVLRENEAAAPFLATPASEVNPRFSPDGRHVVYDSDESGMREVYVRDYPGGGRARVVSSGGGYGPLWSPDGTAIFYKKARDVMAVEVESEPNFRSSKPVILFEAPSAWGEMSYDITPDGERFIMVRTNDTAFRELHVVLNWTQELERLVPTAN